MNRLLVAILATTVGLLCLVIPMNYCYADTGYSISVTARPISTGYHYVFSVYNISRGGGYRQGLDGFYIAMPLDIAILNTYCPPPGTPGSTPAGYWDWLINPSATGEGVPAAPVGNTWLRYWGFEWGSLYNVGTTAVFGFDCDKPLPSSTLCDTVTYWYDPRQYIIASQTALIPSVPEPSSVIAMCVGLMGLVGRIRKRRSTLV